MALAGAQAGVRHPHRGRWRARARGRLLPCEEPRYHQRGGGGARLAGRRQHRAQHHGGALQLSLSRERAALRLLAEALRGPLARAQLQRHVESARARHAGAQPARPRVARPLGECHAHERHRGAAPDARRGGRAHSGARYVSRCTLSRARRLHAAPRGNCTARCRRLGIRARGGLPRSGYPAGLRGAGLYQGCGRACHRCANEPRPHRCEPHRHCRRGSQLGAGNARGLPAAGDELCAPGNGHRASETAAR